MIEKNIVDRVPTYAGRIKLTPVAGQTDVFDMVRADEPTEEGTPLDKATFDSIIHSRLTGRYYEPTITQTDESEVRGLTVSPVPSSGWVVSSSLSSISESWQISTNSATTPPHYAVNNVSNNGWQSGEGIAHSLTITTGSPIKVIKMEIDCAAISQSISSMVIQGSTDGDTWVNLKTVESPTSKTTEYTLDAQGYYKYYRLYFNMSYLTGEVIVRNWAFSQYDTKTYTNNYVITNGVPLEWTELQAITFRTPSTVSTFGVTSNTLNGYPINAILNPARLCRCIFSANTFIAMEV